MIAADLGRAALIASIPAAWAMDRLRIEQLYVVGFLTGTLAVAFDLSWGVRETLFASAIVAVAGALWLVGSPVLRLREMPDTGG